MDTDYRQQVVAVGTPLPTASLPFGIYYFGIILNILMELSIKIRIFSNLGAQQGPVMLTSKNLQCMRALLKLAHDHGSILGTAWHLVLTTLQVITSQ